MAVEDEMKENRTLKLQVLTPADALMYLLGKFWGGGSK